MSLSSVLTMGFQPAGDIASIVLLGYAQTGEAPPPPPVDDAPARYGPALTPWERMRWFSDFDSPLVRAAKRKARERLQRIELGLEEDDVVEELESRTQDLVEKIASREAAAQPAARQGKPQARSVDMDAVAARVAKRVEREIRAELKAIRKDREEEAAEAAELIEMLKGMF